MSLFAVKPGVNNHFHVLSGGSSPLKETLGQLGLDLVGNPDVKSKDVSEMSSLRPSTDSKAGNLQSSTTNTSSEKLLPFHYSPACSINATKVSDGSREQSSEPNNITGTVSRLKMAYDDLPPVSMSAEQHLVLLQHQQYLKSTSLDNRSTTEEEARTSSLFAGNVLTRVPALYAQYGLLGQELPPNHELGYDVSLDSRWLLNVGAPWSAFICGQQGSGKSHTLSVLLENCLVSSPAGNLPKPLAGMVFHWDKFTGYSSHQICEAAYLASAGVPVRVLCSPSNYLRMKETYEHLPGVSPCNMPRVMPLLLKDKQLNVKRMLTMMNVKNDGEAMPLYMEVVLRILREMALERQSCDGLDYFEFRYRLASEEFTSMQNGPMKLRLDLLESFLRTTTGGSKPRQVPQQIPPKRSSNLGDRRPPPPTEIKPLKALSPSEEMNLTEAWTFNPGTLTIVDLSCPFVDENAACALFAICLELFLEERNSTTGRVVALDEAHKFLTTSDGAKAFTEELLQVIRQQRHLGARVIIATQEPTISPRLLELCNFSVVHRFQSPGWFKALKGHLAGASFADEAQGGSSSRASKASADVLFSQIVELMTGEAFLFAPGAISGFKLAASGAEIEPVKLGMRTVRFRTRQRLTADGGRSIMAEYSRIWTGPGDEDHSRHVNRMSKL